MEAAIRTAFPVPNLRVEPMPGALIDAFDNTGCTVASYAMFAYDAPLVPDYDYATLAGYIVRGLGTTPHKVHFISGVVIIRTSTAGAGKVHCLFRDIAPHGPTLMT